MNPSSEIAAQPARNLSQILMQKIAAVKNQTVAQAIRKDESTVSRIVSGETGIKLDDLQAFLNALDLKCVGKNQVCVDRDEFIAYRALAQKYMSKAPELNWEDQ